MKAGLFLCDHLEGAYLGRNKVFLKSHLMHVQTVLRNKC
jgi:hypothetical protein